MIRIDIGVDMRLYEVTLLKKNTDGKNSRFLKTRIDLLLVEKFAAKTLKRIARK